MEDSILFDGVDIGRHAQIRRAIIDKGVQIPERMEIGYDLDQDRARGFTVTDSGIVVIAKTDVRSRRAVDDWWSLGVRARQIAGGLSYLGRTNRAEYAAQ